MESTVGLMGACRTVNLQPRVRRATLVGSVSSVQRDHRDEPRDTSARELEHLWERHGETAYTLACALLGDEVAATEAVRLAMLDLARSDGGSSQWSQKTLTRHVYLQSQTVSHGTLGSAQLPPVMVWVSQLAQLQRASLALCVFGGLNHREAAALLDVPPSTVAELLAAGLRELGRLAAATAPGA